ncbi:MAG: tRNA (adenosine(37)-N6)-dimethylallyltransferase MiaA [Bryobacteraceae bacterium]|nr:tRNA (adenosine(37)-N6)-dimethylallyltransferase MiaA [Bryobacteraceae bacterium]
MTGNRAYPAVAVVGPTGAGKSELAVRLALACDGEVVNCDSLQFYRGMDIGTAKIAEGDRRGVPHHLFDFLEPEEVFTAGEYARRGGEVMREIAERGKLPVLCGGAGFYLQSLLMGLFAGPIRDEVLRKKLSEREQRRPGMLHRYLRRRDAEAAQRIHGNDVNKLIRAVEVCMQEKRSLTELHEERPRQGLEGFRVLKLGLNPVRELLYARIDQRTRKMFEEGLLEEVRGLLAKGHREDAKAFESVGYRQAIAHLAGKIDFEQAVSDTAQRTRNYAKRQGTWFRRDAEIAWLEGFGGEEAVFTSALQQVCRFVKAT